MAVVTCNLTALIRYALAMMCLIILRVKAPQMQRPIAVSGMSIFAAALCVW